MVPTHRQVIVYNVGAAFLFLFIVATALYFEYFLNSHPPLYVAQWTATDSAKFIESFTNLDQLKRYTSLQMELRDTERQIVQSLLAQIRSIIIWLSSIASGLFALGAWLAYVSLRAPKTSSSDVRSNP